MSQILPGAIFLPGNVIRERYELGVGRWALGVREREGTRILRGNGVGDQSSPTKYKRGTIEN